MRSRSAAALAVALVLVGCSDDGDDEPPRAQATTTTASSSPDTEECAGADPAPPPAANGEPAEIVASVSDLVFAIVDRGASVDVVSLFRQGADCAYEPLQLDGSTGAFSVGGSVTHGDGLRCEGGRVTVLSATSDDGRTYQATAVTYEVAGTELVEVDRDASTIESSDPDALGAYYRLDC